jgi:phosphomannomutase
MLMVSVSGIRGIVGNGLTTQVATRFASAYGSWTGPVTIVVGRDSRISGPMLQRAVTAGLQAVGCNVVEIGIAATPTVPMIMKKIGAGGGIAITASHNPAQWNALKMFAPDGLFLDADQGREVVRLYESTEKSHEIEWSQVDELGDVSTLEAPEEEHISRILELKLLDVPALRKRNFNVAIDTVNGAGGLILPNLLLELGCDVTRINSEPTGDFAHTPEPLPENLTELQQTISEGSFDIGFAVDPDVDRLAILDSSGEPLGEERTLCLASKFVLEHNPGALVANISSTRALDDVAAEFSVPIHRTPVGEIHVALKMRETGAAIGGEGNGGVLLPELHLGRDAPVGAALILQQMLNSGKTIRELNSTIPTYCLKKTRIELGERDFDLNQWQEKLQEQFPGSELNLIDGIKIVMDDSWVQIRKSNTEPILRIFAEAPSAEAATELVTRVQQLLE